MRVLEVGVGVLSGVGLSRGERVEGEGGCGGVGESGDEGG